MPERGPYRSLYTCIQDDPEFQKLGPDARLAFYTLKFSPLGNVAGIFVYHIEAGVTHSGLSRSRFEASLGQLQDGRWIVRQGPVVWIRNGLRFEPTYSMSDPNKKKGVERLIAGLPSLSIVQSFADSYTCEAPSGLPRGSLGVASGLPPSPPPYTETETETETETDKPMCLDCKAVIDKINQNQHREGNAQFKLGANGIFPGLHDRHKEHGLQACLDVLRIVGFRLWKNPDTRMYSRPATLFGPKNFVDKYLPETYAALAGEEGKDR